MELDEVIEYLKDKSLIIFLSGSTQCPFIKNPHDIDLIIAVENQEKKLELEHTMIKDGIRKIDLFKNGIDLHIRTLDYIQNFISVRRPWVSKFIKIIYNPNNIMLDSDMFQHIPFIKKNLIATLNEIKKIPIQSKGYYYIYITLCFLKNGNYSLTEEQINNINILHGKDKNNLEQRSVLVQSMLKEIESWQL